MTGIEQVIVEPGEAGMRLDRWFKSHYPGLGFVQLQKLLRSGQVRIDGSRAKAETRLAPGQSIRIPPLAVDRKDGKGAAPPPGARAGSDGELLAKMLLYEDPKLFVFNKPVPRTIRIRPTKNMILPPKNPDKPIDRCPLVISTAPYMIARRSPRRRSAIHPPGNEER